jgi:predicted phosphodiesterase
MRRFNFTDIGEGARLFLSLGDQVYVCMLRHRYRYNSAMNPGHSVMKMYDEHGPFDIGCIGHTHEAGAGWQIKQNKRVAWMRPGSYKVFDGYAEAHGFPRSLPLSPTFIIFPDEKKIMLYDNIADAADALDFFRAKYKKEQES